MRLFIITLFGFVLACGARTPLGGIDAGDDGPRDAGPRRDGGGGGFDSGGGGSCDGPTWELVDVPIDGITRLGSETVRLEVGRSARYLVTHELQACDERAIVLVEVDEGGLTLRLRARVWRPIGRDCPPVSEPVQRVVVHRFEVEGNWTVGAEDGGATVRTRVRVARRDCRPGATTCRLDCDCDEGERCLDGNGMGGPFTMCARSCELNRDCNGDGMCESRDDGLDLACGTGAECSPGDPCPDGYDCIGGGSACMASFDLLGVGESCRCDGDCEGPLSCVVGAGPAGNTCQRRCPTPGRESWCVNDGFDCSEQGLFASACEAIAD